MPKHNNNSRHLVSLCPNNCSVKPAVVFNEPPRVYYYYIIKYLYTQLKLCGEKKRIRK